MAYLPLSTANLPNPVIDPAQDMEPRDYFETFLYTGNGGGLQVGDVIKKPADTTTIANSTSFARNGNASLSRTPSVAGNRRTFTFSCWVKRVAFGSNQTIFSSFNGNSSYGLIRFNTDDTLEIFSYESNVGYNQRHKTIRTFKDTSIWHHILCVWDTTQATSSDRFKLYVDGILELNLSVATYPSQNDDLYFNETELHYIGCTDTSAGGDIRTNFLDGYLAEIHYTVGTAYTSTDFGNFDANGIWIPKAVSGLTYGTNGFYLDFDPTNVSQGSDESATQDTLSGELVHMQFENAFDDSHGKSVSVGGSSNHQFQTSDPKFGTYHIYVPNDTYFDVQGVGRPSNWTHSCWVKTTEGCDSFMARFYENYAGELAQIDSSGTVTVNYGNGSGWTNYNTSYGGINCADGNWHHIAYTHDGSTMKLYVDGRFRSQVSGSITTPAFDYIRFNAYVATGGNRKNISFDQYRMFNEAKPADEIYRLYLERLDTLTSSDASSTVFDVRGFVETDVADSPTDNFMTMSPTDQQQTGGSLTLSEGNLRVNHNVDGHWNRVNGASKFGNGKWYYEFQIKTVPTGTSTNWAVGFREFGHSLYYSMNDGFEDVGDYVYWVDASTAKIVADQDRSVGTTSGITAAVADDYINIAIEKTDGNIKAWFGINGTWFNSGNPATGANPAVDNESYAKALVPAVAFYAYPGSTNGNGIFNFGQKTFSSTIPSGFTAISENNITVDDQNLESPDFVWIKNRDNADNHYLYDTVRGIEKAWASDDFYAEIATPRGLLNFNKNGFTVGDDGGVNRANQDYAAWCWKIGNASTDTTGDMGGAGTGASSITMANTDIGFAITKYYIGSSPDTYKYIPHGLGTTPDCIIVKNLDSGQWPVVYHKDLTANGYLIIANENAEASDLSVFRTGQFDGTNFVVGGSNETGAASTNFISYCFKSVEGFSKFGTYTGNGSSDGTFVYTGFRPSWILIKRKNLSSTGWYLFDDKRNPYNNLQYDLYANVPNAESGSSSGRLDMVSNGFKMRTTSADTNASGGTHIYLAFAENPFKYSLAR